MEGRGRVDPRDLHRGRLPALLGGVERKRFHQASPAFPDGLGDLRPPPGRQAIRWPGLVRLAVVVARAAIRQVRRGVTQRMLLRPGPQPLQVLGHPLAIARADRLVALQTTGLRRVQLLGPKLVRNEIDPAQRLFEEFGARRHSGKGPDAQGREGVRRRGQAAGDLGGTPQALLIGGPGQDLQPLDPVFAHGQRQLAPRVASVIVTGRPDVGVGRGQDRGEQGAGARRRLVGPAGHGLLQSLPKLGPPGKTRVLEPRHQAFGAKIRLAFDGRRQNPVDHARGFRPSGCAPGLRGQRLIEELGRRMGDQGVGQGAQIANRPVGQGRIVVDRPAQLLGAGTGADQELQERQAHHHRSAADLALQLRQQALALGDRIVRAGEQGVHGALTQPLARVGIDRQGVKRRDHARHRPSDRQGFQDHALAMIFLSGILEDLDEGLGQILASQAADGGRSTGGRQEPRVAAAGGVQQHPAMRRWQHRRVAMQQDALGIAPNQVAGARGVARARQGRDEPGVDAGQGRGRSVVVAAQERDGALDRERRLRGVLRIGGPRQGAAAEKFCDHAMGGDESAGLPPEHGRVEREV